MHNYKKDINFILIGMLLCTVLCIGITTIVRNNIDTVDSPSVNIPTNSKPSENDSKTLSVIQEKEYYKISKNNDDIYYGELMLVNYNYECHSDGENTVQLLSNKNNSYLVADGNVYINDGNTLKSLNSMMNDFFQNTGLDNILVSCGFRNKQYQTILYEREIENLGAEGAKWVAKPGYSEHQTGYTLDLSLYTNGIVTKFDGTGSYKWISENCHKYGFILRYASDKVDITKINNEEWHFRYVGVPHSTFMVQNNLCFEEYIDYMKNVSIENPIKVNIENLYTDNKNHIYTIYYVKKSNSNSTNIPLPSETCNYYISGNNVDGFIVTIDEIKE